MQDNREKSHQPETPEKSHWRITHHDGNGNTYRFKKDGDDDRIMFTYSPVTPAFSSSGIYSGGDAKQGFLNEDQSEKLNEWIARLASDSSIQSNSREKGTGAFYVSDSNGEKHFIIKRGQTMGEFSQFLKTICDED